MEIKILEDTKNKLVFEIAGESHTFCNALKKALWKNDDVKVASYRIPHPLVGIPEFTVETKNDTPRKALEKAAKELQKEFSELKSELKNIR